jgi:hypothetical protein
MVAWDSPAARKAERLPMALPGSRTVCETPLSRTSLKSLNLPGADALIVVIITTTSPSLWEVGAYVPHYIVVSSSLTSTIPKFCWKWCVQCKMKYSDLRLTPVGCTLESWNIPYLSVFHFWRLEIKMKIKWLPFAIWAIWKRPGRLPFFSKLFSNVFGQFPKVWKRLEKLEKSLEKLFQTLFARNYYFNAII